MILHTGTISPACLPEDPEETFGNRKVTNYENYFKFYVQFCMKILNFILMKLISRLAVITGWGYTDETKNLKPRPLTSDVLREANVYILSPDLCVKYSPFPITEKESKTNFFTN